MLVVMVNIFIRIDFLLVREFFMDIFKSFFSWDGELDVGDKLNEEFLFWGGGG